jgi:hypothetical protein
MITTVEASDWDVVSDGSESDVYWPDSDVEDDTTRLLGAVNGRMEDEVESLASEKTGTVLLDGEGESESEEEEGSTSDDDSEEEDYDDDGEEGDSEEEDDEEQDDSDDETQVASDSEETSVDTEFTPPSTAQPLTPSELALFNRIQTMVAQQQSAHRIPSPSLPDIVNSAFHTMCTTITALLDHLSSSPPEKVRVTPVLTQQLRELQRLKDHPDARGSLKFTLGNLISVIEEKIAENPAEKHLAETETSPVQPISRTFSGFTRVDEGMGGTECSGGRGGSLAVEEGDAVEPPAYTPRRRGAISLDSGRPRLPDKSPDPTGKPFGPTDSAKDLVQRRYLQKIGQVGCVRKRAIESVYEGELGFHDDGQPWLAAEKGLSGRRGTWEEVKEYLEKTYEGPLYETRRIVLSFA